MITHSNNTSPSKKPSFLNGIIRAFSIDYRTLALLRVCLGGIIFVDLLLRSRDFTAFFTDQGIIPRKLALDWWPDATFSLYFINGSEFFAFVLVAISLLLALALMIGYKTRLVTILSWVLLVSLHSRTSILSHGGEDLLRLLLFWGMFLPLGARFSLDSALETAIPYAKQTLFSVATFGILMQVMYVYWVGALLKTGSAWQVDHTAVYYALSLDQFSTGLGQWVLINLDFLLPYLTQFVFFLELYGPIFMVAPFFLLWFRLPILFLLICMHIGFVLLLNVGFFPYVSITSLLLFMPKEVWQFIGKRWVDYRSENIVVYYDQTCDFCLKTVKILKVMLILPNLTVKPAQEDAEAGVLLKQHDSWVVQKPDGEYLLEWSALVWLFSRSILFFWMKWPLQLMVKLRIGDRVYHWIGERRKLFSAFTAIVLPWRNSNGKVRKFNQVLAFGFFLLILQINMYPIWGSNYIPKLPESLTHVKITMGLWQKWNMFAPYPNTVTSWPIYEGITSSGKKIDIFRHRFGAPSRKKPDDILTEYTNHRWRKFVGRLYLKKFKYFRPYYVKYECKNWNLGRSSKDQIIKIKLYSGREKTLIDASKETTSVVFMGEYSC